MSQHDIGRFTISTRIFLTADQREQLERLVLHQGVDLPELLSTLLTRYLTDLPPLPAAEVPTDVASELRQRRAELKRVRGQQQVAGSGAPTWLVNYIGELEAEIARLERLS